MTTYSQMVSLCIQVDRPKDRGTPDPSGYAVVQDRRRQARRNLDRGAAVRLGVERRHRLRALDEQSTALNFRTETPRGKCRRSEKPKVGCGSDLGTFRTWPVWQTMSAFGCIAEVAFQ